MPSLPTQSINPPSAPSSATTIPPIRTLSASASQSSLPIAHTASRRHRHTHRFHTSTIHHTGNNHHNQTRTRANEEWKRWLKRAFAFLAAMFFLLLLGWVMYLAFQVGLLKENVTDLRAIVGEMREGMGTNETAGEGEDIEEMRKN